LTIGFARRFATYKRATLLLQDPGRLERILNAPGRPVQILFAGKAHPADEPGKELIRQVIQMARRPELRRRIVFLEDYDQNVARYLVQGVDIWLNTPKRPHEASGTSGMKAVFNGGLNQVLAQLSQGLPGIRFVRLDAFRILNDIVANPGAFGLTTTATACLTPDRAPFICDQVDEYLFWDGIHPTKAGHAILAQETANVVQ